MIVRLLQQFAMLCFPVIWVPVAIAQRYEYDSSYYDGNAGSGVGGVVLVAIILLAIFWRQIFPILKELVPAIAGALLMMGVILAALILWLDDVLSFLFEHPPIAVAVGVAWCVWVYREIQRR